MAKQLLMVLIFLWNTKESFCCGFLIEHYFGPFLKGFGFQCVYEIGKLLLFLRLSFRFKLWMTLDI